MFFHPAPGGVLISDGLIVLFNGAHTGAAMSETSTVFATHRYVFQVRHSEVSWGTGLFDRIVVSGPDATDFEAGWRTHLATSDITPEGVEALLLRVVEPERVVDIEGLKAHKVGVGALNNGFYWKPAGAWTWRGFALRQTEAAQALQDFFAGRLPVASASSSRDPTTLSAGAPVTIRWSDGTPYSAVVQSFDRGGYWVRLTDGRDEWLPAENVSSR